MPHPTLSQTITKLLIALSLTLLLLPLTYVVVSAQNGYPEQTDSYINDYANLLNSQDRANVQTLLTDLEAQHGIEAIVLTIGSINDYNTGDATLEAFATNLFNTWGIGDRAKNNGVLLLVAVNDRKVRVEVGSGYENGYNDAMQEVINEHIIPSFRNNNYSQGIYRGTRAIVGELTGTWPPDLSSSGSPSGGTAPQPSAISSSSSSGGGFDFNPYALVGGGATALGAAGVAVQRYLRFRKRKCPDCQTDMARLDEMADDVYLDSGQKVEELINSIDYDVWHCPSCNTHTLEGYKNWFSWIKKCPQCSYRTVKVTSETLEHPTYTSTGRKRVTKDCQHCTYHDTDIVILPMRTRSDDNNSSSFSGGSSSSGGGGSSSGGGASGSW